MPLTPLITLFSLENWTIMTFYSSANMTVLFDTMNSELEMSSKWYMVNKLSLNAALLLSVQAQVVPVRKHQKDLISSDTMAVQLLFLMMVIIIWLFYRTHKSSPILI
jgi:hypothetical protein